MKQRPPLGAIAAAVTLNQLQHRILDEIHRLIGVASGNLRDAERPSLDTRYRLETDPEPGYDAESWSFHIPELHGTIHAQSALPPCASLILVKP